MCGRYALKATLQQLKEQYGAEPSGMFTVEPDYNIGPTMYMPIVLQKEGNRILDKYRWNLVPTWAKSIKTGYKMYNARSESLVSSNSFSRPFASQRCIVPVSGYYEWKSEIPYYITSKQSPLFHFAGLYEHWKGKNDQTVNSYTIITTTPNGKMKELHDRIPAMLLPEEFDTWLDSSNNDTDMLQDLLRPLPNDEIHFHRVPQEVNYRQSSGKHLIEPYQDLFT